MALIHDTAQVSPRARIGEGVEIGPFAMIGDDVTIGANTSIGAFCEIGLYAGVLPPGPLVIGPDSNLRSGSIVYGNSTFGPGLATGHRVTIREGVTAGPGLQVGTLSDVQGHCEFGAYVKLHSNVHVGQGSRVGDYVWIFPYVVLTNDPHPPSETRLGCTIEDFAIVATMSTVLPGVTVGKGALVGAMSLVRSDVPPDSVCVGVPGRLVGATDKIKLKDTGRPAYPWRRHFHRGYPADVVAGWQAEFPEG
jgi:acetyltransferase-like isoleucine patch superfamily enzyme